MLSTEPTTESKVAALVEELPAADKPGEESTFTGPPPEEARRIAAAILERGREGILELVGLIRNGVGGGEKNYKPGYALHCLALHVGAPGMEEARRLVAETVASRLGEGSEKPSREVQAFLVRELQVAGGAEVAAALGELLRDEVLCEQAAMALAAIRDGAAAELRAAWPEAPARCRVALAQALGAVGDRDAVALLEEATHDEERGLRMAATWALAAIGDPAGAGAVVRAADRAEGWERIQADKACLVLAEKVLAAGNAAAHRRICAHLRETRTDPAERHVAEAAARSLGEDPAQPRRARF